MTHLHDYGRQLLDRGLPIVPIRRGEKHPGLPGWQHVRATAALLARWDADKSFEGVGVQAERFPAIDIDVTDVDMAQQVEGHCREVLGECTTRIGNYPKRLIPCRLPASADPYTKITSSTWEDFLGNQHKVEILAAGQQYVAYAVHPTTRKPYTWTDDSLLDPRLLPELPIGTARALTEWFDGLAQAAGWTKVSSGVPGAVVSDEDALANVKPPLDLDLETMKQALDAVKDRAAGSYHEWRDVLFAIHHQTNGSEEGWDLANDWSATAEHRYDPEMARQVWESAHEDAKKNPITFASVLKWAADAGWHAETDAPRPKPHGPWLVPLSDFVRDTPPVPWLIRRWVQANALIMVHGPSTAGKTFLVLDWAMTIAAALPSWDGKKVTPGPVIYLAGEGHRGIAWRARAWAQEHDIDPGDVHIWIAKSGTDLNRPADLKKVIEDIAALGVNPSLIVVDTLHRFFNGDENSAQDAGEMLRACERLMLTFDCSVLLVHHTGVAKDAGQRARGSSAWRAALDIEVSVTVDEQGNRRIEMMKSKDTELVEPRGMTLEQVEIIGALEEGDDGLPAPVTSAVVALCNVAAKVEKLELSKGQRQVLEAFDSVCAEDDGLSRKALRQAYQDLFGQKYLDVPGGENQFKALFSKHLNEALNGKGEKIGPVLREEGEYLRKA